MPTKTKSAGKATESKNGDKNRAKNKKKDKRAKAKAKQVSNKEVSSKKEKAKKAKIGGGKTAKASKAGKPKKFGIADAKTNSRGEPRTSTLPSTLQRSGKKAQRTFATVHDAAAEQYDDAERVNRTAFAALKHTHEKVGDHWERKDQPGPSDARAEGGRSTNTETAGGVDANASKRHLYDVAKRLDVAGRSRMSKAELVDALQKANDKATRDALT